MGRRSARLAALPKAAIANSDQAISKKALRRTSIESSDEDDEDERPAKRPKLAEQTEAPKGNLVMDIVAWNVQRKLNLDNAKSRLAAEYIGDTVISLFNDHKIWMIFLCEVNSNHDELVKDIERRIDQTHCPIEHQYHAFPGEKQDISQCGFLVMWNSAKVNSKDLKMVAIGGKEHIKRPMLKIEIGGYTYCGVHLISGSDGKRPSHSTKPERTPRAELQMMAEDIGSRKKGTLFLGDMNIHAAERKTLKGQAPSGEVPEVAPGDMAAVKPIKAAGVRWPYLPIFPKQPLYTHGSSENGDAEYTLLDFGFSNFVGSAPGPLGTVEAYYPFDTFTFAGNYPDHMPIGFRVRGP